MNKHEIRIETNTANTAPWNFSELITTTHRDLTDRLETSGSALARAVAAYRDYKNHNTKTSKFS